MTALPFVNREPAWRHPDEIERVCSEVSTHALSCECPKSPTARGVEPAWSPWTPTGLFPANDVGSQGYWPPYNLQILPDTINGHDRQK